jgi:hypothetical protein
MKPMDLKRLKLALGEARPIDVPALACRCSRCEALFVVVGEPPGSSPAPPPRCRECRVLYWQEPVGTRPRGRPPKPAGG